MNEIKLVFTTTDQQINIIKCHIQDRLINMLEAYCQIKNIEKDSIYIIYNGNVYTDYDITIDKLANKESKLIGEVILLVNHVSKTANIKFNHSGELHEITEDTEKNINVILYDYLKKKNIDENTVVLKFDDDVIESDQTINQFITKNKKKLLGNKNQVKDDKPIEIKFDIIDIQKVSKIKFTYNKTIYEQNYSLERTMKDIFKDYAKENNINLEKVEFLDNNKNTIDKNQSFGQFKNYLNEEQKKGNKKNDEQDQTQIDINSKEIVENSSKINIDVKDLSCLSYFFKKYKIIFFIILGVIIIVGAILLIVLLLKKNNDKNGGTSSTTGNPIIPNDYFINAEYISQQSETVKLISNEYDINKIKNMSIDGNIIQPTKTFTFNESGLHNVYYSFNPINDESLLSEGRFLFNGIANLIRVEISNYNGSYPDVSFHGMFNNCINLQEADFSKMKLNFDYFNYYSYDIFEYYSSMDYMFNNCTSLTLVNFDFKRRGSRNGTDIASSKYMFNNCKSLIELNLNKLYFYSNLNNMFSNCISLEVIYFNDFKYWSDYLNMSYMFYNCTSLTSLSFPSSELTTPHDMSYSFANCTSLKKLHLEFLNHYYYDDNKRNMSSAFKNCISLTSIRLQFDLDFYEDLSYAFMNCYSLENLDMVYYYYYSNVKYMNGMFLNCFYLSDFKMFEFGFFAYNLIDISYMFANTSITNISFFNLDTSNIINYEGLFYDCDYLELVDLSSFTHNNLTGSNLSIFRGEYYYDPILIVNKEFLSKIQVPNNFTIIIYNGSINHTIKPDGYPYPTDLPEMMPIENYY